MWSFVKEIMMLGNLDYIHDYKKGYSLYGILRKKFGVSGELILGFAGEINWGI